MQTPLLYDLNDTEDYEARTPQLERFDPQLREASETPSAPSPQPPASGSEDEEIIDPGTEVLIANLAPNRPELHRVALPRTTILHDAAMTERPQSAKNAELSRLHGSAGSLGSYGEREVATARVKPEYLIDAEDLQAKATTAVSQQQADARLSDDSRQNRAPQLPHEKRQSRSGRNSPALTIQTLPIPHRQLDAIDTLATSPTLGKHMRVRKTEDSAQILPALQTTSPLKDAASSPQAGKLPSFHQVVAREVGHLGALDELAELSGQQSSHHHSPSVGSATALSPSLAYHYGANSRTAASPYYVIPGCARSPTSTTNGDNIYASPTQQSNRAYFNDRRSSAPAERHPAPPPSLPSASSSGESYGATSSTDGYSTAHTTPIDAPERPSRLTLPAPPDMSASTIRTKTIMMRHSKTSWRSGGKALARLGDEGLIQVALQAETGDDDGL
ncbi:hypothetical protein LTR37_018736 [Vermiconidia calcicola]|uniref:Uncharacterized protein n=1 Tax=Vermiconidia calcicola TaxID=1690605 RepID=A0ACC3MJ55_9PEZI|nr:hypothetical protein LTR37_018736 [Vermiconidia calcicola]